MNNIAGIPYLEASFDTGGALTTPVTLPGGITDLIVISHGWNNSADDARALYRELVQNFAGVGSPGDLPGRSFAVGGVSWPSKKFDELVAVAGVPGHAAGAAALAAADTRSDQARDIKWSSMAEIFTSAPARQTLDELRARLPWLTPRHARTRRWTSS
jgi:hypothetical protein